MFRVLEERSIEPMIYEEIEAVENHHYDKDQQQSLRPPISVTTRGGDESNCKNTSVMEVRDGAISKIHVYYVSFPPVLFISMVISEIRLNFH